VTIGIIIPRAIIVDSNLSPKEVSSSFQVSNNDFKDYNAIAVVIIVEAKAVKRYARLAGPFILLAVSSSPLTPAFC
jgi:hypothetical protein